MARETHPPASDAATTQLTCAEFTPTTARAYLSNGLIGVQPGPNPLADAPTAVSGYVTADPATGQVTTAKATYPFLTDIVAGGVSMLDQPQRVTVEAQTLDIACGELTTRMAFTSAADVRLNIDVFQFLSRSTPSLACQEIRITPSADVNFSVTARANHNHDPQKLGVALAGPTTQDFDAKAGRTYVFLTMAALVSEAYHSCPQAQAQRMAAWGNMLGFDQLHRLNRQAWDELWQSRVRVIGDHRAQQALDAAFYHVHASCHPSCMTGVAAAGLTDTPGPMGTVQQDMDFWICSALLPAAPETARGMLDYRLNSLHAARKAAALFGLRGAHFPAQAGPDGEAAWPAQANDDTGNHLAPPAVAIAFWEYFLATGDEDFLRRGTWPVLSDVAAWIESRGDITPNGFEIRNAGPTEGIANRTDLNLIARMAMTAAIRCAGYIGYSPPDAWQTIARSIVIPTDPVSGIVSAWSGAQPRGDNPAYAPGALQRAFFHDPVEYGAIGLDLFRRTWEAEETLRTELPASPENPGSVAAPAYATAALSTCAAFFGDRKKAAELFHAACEPYQSGPFGMLRRFRNDDNVHCLTSQSAVLLAAMYGFTGMRLREGNWAKYQARLPEGWERIEIPRLWVRGVPMRLFADHANRARLIEA